MPNGYATVPSIIPGTLTVNGDLLVNGRTFRLGTGTRKFRIQETTVNLVYQHLANYDGIAGVQDDAAGPTAQVYMDVNSQLCYLGRGPAGGAPSVRVGTEPGIGLNVLEDLMRLGVATPFVRLFKSAPRVARWTSNLATDLVTRDDVAQAASLVQLNPDDDAMNYRSLNSAGAITTEALARVFGLNNTQVTVTGTVAETTVYSKVIRANTLGAHGALAVHWMLIGVAQGAIAASFRLKLGATTLAIFTKAVTDNMFVIYHLLNRGATNVQDARGHAISDAGTVTSVAGSTGGLDTTLDQTLSITIQPGAVGDRWDSFGVMIGPMTGAPAAF